MKSAYPRNASTPPGGVRRVRARPAGGRRAPACRRSRCPAAGRLRASAAAEKCGHRREAGYRRTSSDARDAVRAEDRRGSPRAGGWSGRRWRSDGSSGAIRLATATATAPGSAVRAERGAALDDHDVRLGIALADLAGERSRRASARRNARPRTAALRSPPASAASKSSAIIFRARRLRSRAPWRRARLAFARDRQHRQQPEQPREQPLAAETRGRRGRDARASARR